MLFNESLLNPNDQVYQHNCPIKQAYCELLGIIQVLEGDTCDMVRHLELPRTLSHTFFECINVICLLRMFFISFFFLSHRLH
jgi:hypothetical protein